MNILVPTDFSILSKVAVEYAIHLANRLDGVISLLHVVTITQPVRVSMHGKMRGLEEDLMTFAKRDLFNLIKDVSYGLTTAEPIHSNVVRSADFENAVKNEICRTNAEMIVMGTNGASGLKKTVIGSNTASVIEYSDVPVMAVPKNAEFRGFRDIVYATDLTNADEELKKVVSYAEKFGSTIHMLHVAPSGSRVDELEARLDSIVENQYYKNIVTLVLVDNFIEGAIDQYLGIAKADLLMMFTHNLTFYEKLFDRSHTRRMAFQSSVPLLAFQQTKR